MSFRGGDIKVALPGFFTNTSVLKLLSEALCKNGNKTAQVEGKTGKSEKFSYILQQSSSIAAGLQSVGVTAGDFIVMCCDKSILAYSILLGTMFTGATAVLVNVQGASEIHQYTAGHSVKAVFCDSVHLESVTKSVALMIPSPVLVATVDIKDPVIVSLINTTEEFCLFDVKDVKKHITLVLFTSGVTGKPKGVQISDVALQRFGFSFEDESIETYLLMSTFWWVSSAISLVSSILKGYTLVLSNSSEPSANLLLIQKYKVNGWTVHSSAVNTYSKEPSLPHVDLTSLTLVNIGGEMLLKRVSQTFIEKVLKGRVGVQNVYGLTETGILTTWRNVNLLHLPKSGSSGYLAPGVEIKVLDDEGNGVAPGCVGQLWVKSFSLMAGYWNRPELNNQLFDKDGFFRTGDAGYFDNEGYLYLRGRVDDLIICGQNKISVSETEDIVKSHPEVIDAAVVAKPHLKDSYYLAAFVVKKQDSNITEDEIAAFVEEQVQENEKLKGVYFIDRLPKTSNYKVHRRVLQEMFLSKP